MFARGICFLLVAALAVSSAWADLPDFTRLIEDNSAAVVKIKATEKAPERRGLRQRIPEGQLPDIFRDFFGDRYGDGGRQYRQPSAMGSGFFISSDGYVLTNNHVIGEADEIMVRLIDRREYSAEVVGVDPRSDLALLKIDATGLPTVKLAPPGEVKVGEWVVAIGSPFGLDYSASAGIVSAIGRSIPTARGEDYVPFIQSDVAINPGNSGGPLFNLKGEVIGVNSQIYTRSGGSIGLSFAIPMSVVADVVQQLKSKGRVDRGWLGVYIQDVDKNLAESLGLERPVGALIAQVEPGSPADKAGMQAGDVVVEFNDREIVEASDLPHTVGLMAPGKKAPVVVIRKSKKKSLQVTIGARPDEDGMSGSRPDGDLLGLTVEDVDDELRDKWRLSGGVVVVQVAEDSPATEAGLRIGDVIVQLGYRGIANADDYREVLKEMPRGAPVALRFFRNGRSVFRTIEID